jgi:hypothetical protein
MRYREADRCDVDEGVEAFGGLVITGGDAASVFLFVGAPLDEVPQPVEFAADGHTQFARLPHWDHEHDVACLHSFGTLSES